MDVPQETTVDTQCRHVTEHPPQETSIIAMHTESAVSYTHLRAHETA